MTGFLGPWLEQVQLSPNALPTSQFNVHCWRMTPTIEKISAITLRVMNMKDSVLFYQNVLGMKLLYGGERTTFSSLRASDSASAIINLEQGGQHAAVGPADLPRYGCGCVLGTSAGQRI
jgi:catechol 2,3-dioxygenase-like lactoylglutathione lyase family enzyme